MFFLIMDCLVCRWYVSYTQKLDLANHLRWVCLGDKASPSARQLCHEGCSCHHGGFLDRHGHQHFPPVDNEVERNSQGQGMNTHHVLNHVVSLLSGQTGFAPEPGNTLPL